MSGTKKAIILCMSLIFLLGICIFIYPHLHGVIKDSAIENNAQVFLDKYDPEAAPAETVPIIPDAKNDIENAALFAEMQKYNKNLWAEKQSNLTDPWSYQQPSFYLPDYNLADEVFGVISIPKLDLQMPLYLGATKEHLAAGAAHLSQTSIPIGGINTNSVIAGHRGWHGASYFKYITDLVIGDTVILSNLWETLTYKVIEIKIVEPNDVEEILIREGQDLITLLTCHPYASGGRYRYLVFCQRTP